MSYLLMGIMNMLQYKKTVNYIYHCSDPGHMLHSMTITMLLIQA
jgi:hypothetical protein